MSEVPVFSIKRGDTGKKFEATLFSEGLPVNLTGASPIELHTRHKVSGIVASFALVLVGGGIGGQVEYQWIDGDTDISGEYDAEVEAVIAGERFTWPDDGLMLLEFVADLADAT